MADFELLNQPGSPFIAGLLAGRGPVIDPEGLLCNA
jgi:hypothetical protein